MKRKAQGLAPEVILLVEDNSDHAELLKRLFQKQGVWNPICHISDGETALKYLFRQEGYGNPTTSPRPCLVLLDLRLPKVDGLEVLKAVRTSEKLQNLPIFILSTSDRKEDVDQAYSLRANGFLVKPVEGYKLHQLIQSLSRTQITWGEISPQPDGVIHPSSSTDRMIGLDATRNT